MKIFEIRNKKKKENSLKVGDFLYDIKTGYRYKILEVDNVFRYGKNMFRYLVKQGYIYENNIKRNGNCCKN